MLQSTGAFEIYIENERIWSKVESGYSFLIQYLYYVFIQKKIPQIVEFLRLLNFSKRLTATLQFAEITRLENYRDFKIKNIFHSNFSFRTILSILQTRHKALILEKSITGRLIGTMHKDKNNSHRNKQCPNNLRLCRIIPCQSPFLPPFILVHFTSHPNFPNYSRPLYLRKYFILQNHIFIIVQ
jgi:hypothetical protein